MRIRQLGFLLSLLLLLLSVQPVKAQTGKLVVHAQPRQTYVYVDGAAIVDSSSHWICLSAGAHKVDLYNYGYKPETRNVTIAAHKKMVLEVTLQPIPGDVSGPWGDITIKGAQHNAILLNGQDPAVFFVGHGGEFTSEGKRELVVPPGKYDLTIQCNCASPWSTSVDVPPNQRVIVNAYTGVASTVPWPHGEKLRSLPRFLAQGSSVRVAVEKVTGQFSASAPQINCGDSAHLNWSSTGAARAELNGQAVGPSGDQTVNPQQTTSYKFVAAGPGGIYNADATVNVSNSIPASLSVSPAEVRYHKVGDRVDQQPTATVSWSATNAQTVSVDPLGSVGANGSREMQITPSKTTPGPIDETVTYTLHATNACGANESRTASLHIVGSYEAPPVVNEATLETQLTFNSIYFPTNQPTVANPDAGLVTSQQLRLNQIVTNFKEYLTLRPEANLILEAHADQRGSSEFNMALTERRDGLVKNYLIQNGIPADKIQTKAFGKEKNLTSKEVRDLADQNSNLTPADRQRVDSNIDAFRMANNRRVDLRLSTTGQTSQRFFPYNSDDLTVLLGAAKPAGKAAAKKPAGK
jgi:outer membrane protein OmpA-like peptidoglycan-associated protein